MTVIAALIRTMKTFRRFVWPEYYPERHYMRGPGPACKKRDALLG